MLVSYEQKGFVYLLTISNPPVNVLTDQLLNDLDDCINEINAKSDCRVLIVTGAGEKAFVAGADIKQFLQLDAEEGSNLVEKGKKIFDKLAHASYPVICAIKGLALGGGLELALACDIRIAERKAKLGLPETGLAILPGYGGTQRLAKLIGPGRAKEMIFTGAPISAEQAYEWGVVERVVPDGESVKEAYTLAEKIVTKGPLAIAKAKQAISYGLDRSLEEGQAFETQCFAELCLTEDMQEGAKAFLEKRVPIYDGK
ncbi:enoyl-CoA hydratase/isomerase family protein [Neobacillus mesonae]|uniref:enoyl-CoA hydratase/isomerase family protein n=1 Tax=Neobacillus mesonae TaxID=1193713 RepID=UPI00203B9EB3|nr:enoyl-CoA hydratase-related protein [Neobacillus mesonae]MCM3570333.1 enoyl-CoA hydratase-related protein [Neobacillus mesonae]